MKRSLFLTAAFLCACRTDLHREVQQSNIDSAIMAIDTRGDASPPPDASRPPITAPGAKLLLIGDSLAVGLRAQFQNLALRDGYVPVTHAVGGTVTHSWMTWLKADIAHHKPDLIFISLGTNDTGFPAAVINERRGEYADLVEMAQKSGATVVWIGLPKLNNKQLFPNAEMVRGIVRGTVPIYFDSEKVDFPQPDTVHSTPQGYIKWMDEVWKWADQRGIIRATR